MTTTLYVFTAVLFLLAFYAEFRRSDAENRLYMVIALVLILLLVAGAFYAVKAEADAGAPAGPPAKQKFVLIYALTNEGTATGAVKFDSFDLCREAADRLAKQFNMMYRVQTLCVPTEEKHP